MAVLWLNGKEMPDPAAPDGITITKEPVWSKNAGRGSTAKFIGDIVGYKFTIQIKWPILSQRQTAMIDAAVTEQPFFTAKFIDPTDASGAFVEKTVYAGSPTYPVYSYVEGLPRYIGVGLKIVEQ
ncbi:MAG TPA: hypothetical protein DF613_16750 [Lachnospiraceae bacterium]|nr:hypothetical protein [Lachnospiraceae bacterium]